MADDYAIYIGGKPFMNYVTAVVMQFTAKNADKVVIRSRGKFISKAVDVAEVVRSRFLKDQVSIENMEIGSEEFNNREGRNIRVSTFDIVLEKIVKKAETINKKKKTEDKKEESKEQPKESSKENKEEQIPESKEDSKKE